MTAGVGTWECHWRRVWSHRERAEMLAAERETAEREGRVAPRIPEHPKPLMQQFPSRELAERHAAKLRGTYGAENVVVCIVKRLIAHPPKQLMLAADWPVQRRSNTRKHEERNRQCRARQ